MRAKIVITSKLRAIGISLSFLALAACAHVERMLYSRPFEPTSFAAFQRIRSNPVPAKSSPGGKDSTLLWAYLEHIAPIIYSQCKNWPSDSAYLGLSYQKQCSAPLAISISIGRMLREHDLPAISSHLPFVVHGHLVWPDFPIGCSL